MLIFFSENGDSSARLAEKADKALEKEGKKPIGLISKTNKGAPVCENGYVSFSHTEGLTLMAFSDVPVGIDVEKEGRKVPSQMKDVKNWTAYEAKCKMSGEGISLAEVRQGGDFTKGVRYIAVSEGYVVAVAGGDSETHIVGV